MGEQFVRCRLVRRVCRRVSVVVRRLDSSIGSTAHRPVYGGVLWGCSPHFDGPARNRGRPRHPEAPRPAWLIQRRALALADLAHTPGALNRLAINTGVLHYVARSQGATTGCLTVLWILQEVPHRRSFAGPHAGPAAYVNHAMLIRERILHTVGAENLCHLCRRVLWTPATRSVSGTWLAGPGLAARAMIFSLWA